MRSEAGCCGWAAGALAAGLAMIPPCAARPPQFSPSPRAVPERSTAPEARRASALASIEADLHDGRFRRAQARARRLLAIQPRNALAWTYLGMASLHLEERERAILAFEKAIAIKQNDPLPYLNLALLYAAKNDVEKAMERYQSALTLDPRNGTACYNYARLLMARERYQEAEQALKRAVAINPADAQARTSLVEVLLRNAKPQEADEQVRLFLQAADLPAAALVSMGALLVRAGGAQFAQEVLSRAIELAPDSASAHLELARLHLSLNDQEGAVRAGRRAVELAPQSLEIKLGLAEILIGCKRHIEALEFLASVRRQFEGSAAFHYTAGAAHVGAKQFLQAIPALEEAVRLDPHLDLAQFLLGTAWFSTGELERAETAYRAAIAASPKNALYHAYLARLYERKGPAFQDAMLKYAKAALALDPRDAESKLLIARWQTEHGYVSQARKLLEETVAADPKFIQARVLLALVYYKLKLRKEGDEQREAIRALETEQQQRQGAESQAPPKP